MNKGICIIPARGGSKGVPHKAVKRLGGLPLISWTLAAAVSSQQFDYIFVTTDDQEIENVVKENWREVQVLQRPGYLATDAVQTDEVYRQALRQLFYESEKWFGKKEFPVERVPYVALLDPTCPFRDKDDIIRAVSKYDRYRKFYGACPTVFCAVQDRKFHWKRTFQGTDYSDGVLYPTEHDPSMRVGRQSVLSWLYRESGAAYIIDPVQFLEKGNYRQPPFIGYYLDETHAVEIDEPLDWLIAEAILTEKEHLG